MIKTYKKYWKKIIQFDGYSSRSDYWWVFLVNSLIFLVLTVVRYFVLAPQLLRLSNRANTTHLTQEAQNLIRHPSGSLLLITIIIGIAGLLILVPNLSLTSRRLRDGGFPWWFMIFFGIVAFYDLMSTFITLSVPHAMGWILDIFLFATYILCLFPSKYRDDEDDDSRNYD